MNTKLHWKTVARMDEALNRADKSNDVRSKVCADGKYIRTPWELCEEIIGQIDVQSPLLGKKILVVDTVEFIPVLLAFGVEKCNITYIAPYEFKGMIAEKGLGVRVVQKSLLEWKPDMKFDIVVGNPPYQLTSSKKLWPAFTQLSLNSTKENGYTALIIPSSWLTSNSSSFKKVREKLTTEHNLEIISRTANSFFDVGQDILWFLSCHKPYNGKTYYLENLDNQVIDLRKGIPQTEQELFISEILSKIINSSDEKLSLISEETFPSNEVMKERNHEYKYRCIYSTANIGFTKVPIGGYGKLKIALNYSSAYFSEKADDKNMPITTDCIGSLMAYFEIGTEEIGLMMRSYLSSKLYRFFVSNYKKKNTGFSDAVKRRMLPKLEEKFWTDIEIYQHFGLTQEEIDYIEATVK
jgi:type I restriction-modification system DNA methylase subunit